MSGTVSAPPAGAMPAIPYPVELGLTVLHTALCASLFLFAYLQLWLLLCSGAKRLSYRTLCLFLCLLWAALRTVLFACYLPNALRAAPLPRQPFARWLLHCSPGCLLFASQCLLNLYFAEVIFKVKCAAEFNKYKVLLYLGSIFTSLLFLVVNLTCAMLIHEDVPESRLRWTVFVRALVNDSLFILCAISLACCMCKLAKMSSANVYLESKGTSVCQAILVGSVVVLLYSSRACYNLVAVTISPENIPSPFNYGWDNFSDKMHAEEVGGEEYVVFGVVLFLWELVPTSFVVLFFRAQRLTQNLTPAGMINSHSYSSRAYFFDNPRRYDSDDDLPRLGAREGGSLATPQCSSWYGTLTGSDSCAVIPEPSGPKPDTAPLLFTCSDLETNNHHSLYSTPQN
ncbi:integral membrane protein GPR137C isoform X2 [Dermochelys coriacea]|uniref:integral membrane protein GPR137C isoform X2 n=1 Tax=Dermochelys coriacea TaxID=27794 RepID=UPI0018E71308|nr:integral membrane protein GPR137C isoform X2 [Dermochelys coriacea]